MVGTKDASFVVCCFCGQYLSQDVAVQLVVFPPNAEGESQTLYCHCRHLVEHLNDSIPHHPALDENPDDPSVPSKED